MRFSVFAFLLLITLSCHKPDDGRGTGNDIDFTPIPQSATVNTAFTVYTSPGNPVTDEHHAYINNNECITGIECFYTNQVQTNEHNTVVHTSTYHPEKNYNTRLIPVTSSIMNYVDVRFPAQSFKVIDPINPGTYNLPGNETLTLPANSLTNPNSPLLPTYTWLSHFYPVSPEFGITIPTLAADFDNNRWFLQSFGGLDIDIDFAWEIKPTADVRWTLPIPAGLSSIAPDSVAVWFFSNEKWVRRGTAVKSNNAYTTKIDKKGFWLLAVPVKGLYMNVKARTDKGVPLVNAGLRVKHNSSIVAGGRTDADGNLRCFIPAHADLTVELTTGKYSSMPTFTRSLGNFQTAGDIEFSVPANSSWLVTTKGTVKACDGTPLLKGTVTMKSNDYVGFTVAHVPVNNGVYSAAMLVNESGYILKAFGTSTNDPGRDSAVILSKAVENTVNLTTCAQNNILLLNYSVDGVSNSLTGNWSTPNNPFLNGYLSGGPPRTMIACTNSASSVGIQFITNAHTTGTFTGADISGIWVNGAYRSHDSNKPYRITFTRYDLNINGFIEGSVDVYYMEGTVSRHLVASFRVKRIT